MRRDRCALGTLLALFGLSLACGRGEGTPSPTEPPTPLPTVALRVVGSGTAEVGRVLLVVVPGFQLSASHYDGRLGGTPLTATIADDSTLVMIVPEVRTGPGSLEIDLFTHRGSVSVTVIAGASIADPAGAIDAAVAR